MRKLNIFFLLHLVVPITVFVLAITIERTLPIDVLTQSCQKLQGGWLKTWLPATQANCDSTQTVAAYPVVFLCQLICSLVLPAYLIICLLKKGFDESNPLNRFNQTQYYDGTLAQILLPVLSISIGVFAFWAVITTSASTALNFGRSHYLATPYLQAFTACIQSFVLIFSSYFVAFPLLAGILNIVNFLKR